MISSKIKLKKIILLNASMAGYISELGAENLIIACQAGIYLFRKNSESN
jgi:iron complex transport system substrate-binding protein